MREHFRKLFAIAIVTASGAALAGTDHSASASSTIDPGVSSESSMATESSVSSASRDPALSDPSGTTPNESMEDRSLSASGTNGEEPLARGDQGTEQPGLVAGERAGEPIESARSPSGETSEQAAIDCSLNADDPRCQSDRS